MHTQTRPPSPPPVAALPLAAAADLQDHLMSACNDLQRLNDLLANASDVLMTSFHGAREQLAASRQDGNTAALMSLIEPLQQKLSSAVTALQFQDLAAQLIQHTHQRLRGCADRLACDALGADEDDQAVFAAAPQRPNPVTQAEMDAGAVELF